MQQPVRDPESSVEIENSPPSPKQQNKFWRRLWNSESARMVRSTLFPTLHYWKEKNFWQKILAVLTVPSVFLLTITLPVVEPASPEVRVGENAAASVPAITVSNAFDNGRRAPNCLIHFVDHLLCRCPGARSKPGYS